MSLSHLREFHPGLPKQGTEQAGIAAAVSAPSEHLISHVTEWKGHGFINDHFELPWIGTDPFNFGKILPGGKIKHTFLYVFHFRHGFKP